MCHVIDIIDTKSEPNAQNSIKPSSPKFTIGDVVYVRAIITDYGSCGQPAVHIKQPGSYAIVVPLESEVFKGKSKTSTIITLEAQGA